MADQPASRRVAWIVGTATVLLCGIVQAWIASEGAFLHWPTYRHDESALAAAFLHGQLSLLEKPSPQLLALPDPYDPTTNGAYRLHDEALYGGRYYEYWGPAPSLLIAAICWPLGIRTPGFGDQYPAAIWLLGTVAIAAALIFHLRRYYFPNQRMWTAVVPVVSLGLGAPFVFVATRLAVYEAAIAAGQFFLLAGLYAAWWGIQRKKVGWLWLTGVCWTLACASRVSLPPAVAAMTFILFWAVWHEKGMRRLTAIAAVTAPLILGAGLMAWYNHARFGSVTEFGLRYQLSGSKQIDPSVSGFISLANFWPGVVSYLSTPPATSHNFPYLFIQPGRVWLAEWMRLPKRYWSEPVTGLVWIQPFLILGLIAILKAKQSGLGWMCWALAAGGLLSLAPGLLLSGTTMRYLVDLVPCITVLAAVGLWVVLSHLTTGSRWAPEFAAAVRLVVAYQCVVGVLLAISDDHKLLNVASWYLSALGL